MSYNFDIFAKDIFNKLLKHEQLIVSPIDEQNIIFNSPKREYAIEFTFSRDGVNISYIVPISDKEELQYDLDEYVSSNIIPEDRTNIDLNYNTFFDRLIIELKILNNTCERLNSFIFSKKEIWFEDYKNSPYFSEPKLMERRI